MSEKNPIVGLCQKASFLISAAQVDQCPRRRPGSRFRRALQCRQVERAEHPHSRQPGAHLENPGRTQLLNFFALDDSRRLVDLPGYGYAKVPIP